MIGFGGATEAIVKYRTIAALAILLLLALAVLLSVCAQPPRSKWRWISIGSVVATVLDGRFSAAAPSIFELWSLRRHIWIAQSNCFDDLDVDVDHHHLVSSLN